MLMLSARPSHANEAETEDIYTYPGTLEGSTLKTPECVSQSLSLRHTLSFSSWTWPNDAIAPRNCCGPCQNSDNGSCRWCNSILWRTLHVQGLPLLSTFVVDEWLMMFRDIKISIISLQFFTAEGHSQWSRGKMSNCPHSVWIALHCQWWSRTRICPSTNP